MPKLFVRYEAMKHKNLTPVIGYDSISIRFHEQVLLNSLHIVVKHVSHQIDARSSSPRRAQKLQHEVRRGPHRRRASGFAFGGLFELVTVGIKIAESSKAPFWSFVTADSLRVPLLRKRGYASRPSQLVESCRRQRTDIMSAKASAA